MPFTFAKKITIKKKKRPVPFEALIPPNRVITSHSLPAARRLDHFIHNDSVSSVVLPGGIALLSKSGQANRGTHRRRESLKEEDVERDWANDISNIEVETHTSPGKRKEKRKTRAYAGRQKHAMRWSEEVLPRILPLYLQYRATRTSTDVPIKQNAFDQACQCNNLIRLKIIVLYWRSLEEIIIDACSCNPAPEQLVRRGLFPNSPLRPSIAADMHLLDLISGSFFHLTLNLTGWANLLEEFWAANGFYFQSSGTLRHRLTSCLFNYQQLLQLVKIRINSLHPRDNFASLPSSPKPMYAVSESASDMMDVSSVADADDTFVKGDAEEPQVKQSEEKPVPLETLETDIPFTNVFTGPTVHLPHTPSQKLAARCPICFGGPRPDLKRSRAHAIVCIDACFSQKRRKTKYLDSPFITFSSVFLSPDRISLMEMEVSQLRAKGPKAKSKALPVADSILNDCERSFTAAQSDNTTASTTRFDDTGLMALLCRHDHVLFLANLKSTGEKQYYALALLSALFDELPNDWKVGVLYDIGCQLHRSCEKYGFLPKYRSRIIWGISVFHAYGHQWACQLVYHPRKRLDFGLSDGEGCERFWSSISHLVSPLRVVNYHRRLFALDLNIQHLSDQTFWNLGVWFQRKLKALVERTRSAKEGLLECDIAIPTLRTQWSMLVQAQTKELPRQNQRAAEKMVGKLLLLREELDDERRKLGTVQQGQQFDLEDEVPVAASVRIEQLEVQIQHMEKALGTGFAQMTLKQAEKDKFLLARLATQVLRERLITKIQARKFELSRLTQHSRRPALGNRLYIHTKSSVSRRDSGIKSLAQSFNRHVQDMERLKSTTARYKKEIVPKIVDTADLFGLDVFSTLFEDYATLSSESADQQWRRNPTVRRGVQFLLELDRCDEEKERLDWEKSQLINWAINRADFLNKTYQSLDLADIGMVHGLSAYICQFRSLLIHWGSFFKNPSGRSLFLSALSLIDQVPSVPRHIVSNRLETMGRTVSNEDSSEELYTMSSSSVTELSEDTESDVDME